MRTIGVLVVLSSFCAGGLLAQQTTFRAGTTLVTVDVSVHKGNNAVAGLTAADFLLTDNGVPQTVESVSVDAMPVNLTLLLDTSGSVAGMIESLKDQIREAAAILRDDDQIRLLIFAGDAAQVFPMQSPRADLRLEAVRADGGTSLYDALALGLIRKRPPDRGELVVAFTDGIDTTSAMGVNRLKDVARRSEAVLHAFIVRSPELVRLCAPGPSNPNAMPWLCDQSGLEDIAKATGGRLYTLLPRRHVPEGLRRALEDFRTSYTLRYRPHGVTPAGWHDIAVRIARTDGRYAVRARRGYVGS